MGYKRVRQMVDEQFAKNLRQVYPHKSFRAATKSLNDILEEILYGKKKH